MGAITERVRRYVPSTYRALVETTVAAQKLYSTGDVQALADLVKYKLYGTSYAAEAAEASTYDPLVLQFMGKLTTLHFIPPAIDFWGSQLASKTTTGTSEVVAYRDQRDSLWKLFDELTKQVEMEAVELGFVIHGIKGLVPRVSYGDNGRGVLLTPDPQDFPASYDVPTLDFPWSTPA